MCIEVEIKKMERERERDEKLGEVRDPNVKWGPPECGKWGGDGGSGDHPSPPFVKKCQFCNKIVCT
jgi:hypothetical protein